jgi:hypothetical protein
MSSPKNAHKVNEDAKRMEEFAQARNVLLAVEAVVKNAAGDQRQVGH